jgi:UPF0755 protein
MEPDDSSTHRLGKFGPEAGLLVVESLDDPTLGADPALNAVRPSRAYFTLADAQPKNLATFNSAALASSEPGAGGIEGDSVAPESVDGKALAYGDDVASFPISPRQRAEQKARAAKLGLAAGSDDLPDGVIGARDQSTELAAYAVAASNSVAANAGAAAPAGRRIHAVDASEGTALDPLRDRSWDLSSAKTVPASASLR